jgi:hypothetical protein
MRKPVTCRFCNVLFCAKESSSQTFVLGKYWWNMSALVLWAFRRWKGILEDIPELSARTLWEIVHLLHSSIYTYGAGTTQYVRRKHNIDSNLVERQPIKASWPCCHSSILLFH